MIDNPFTAKARPKLRSFGAGKKPSSADNGSAPRKMSPWAAKLAARQEAEIRGILHPGSEKADFTRDGINYSNCRDHGGWWSIDVSTGDLMLTFHNRYGSWMADLDGDQGRIEARREVAFACQSRYLTELKRIGAPLPFFLRTASDKREVESQKHEETAKSGKRPPPKKKPAAKAKPAKKAAPASKPTKPKLKGWGKK